MCSGGVQPGRRRRGRGTCGVLVKQRFGMQKKSCTKVLVIFQKVRWVQVPKDLTLSVLGNVSRRIERNGRPTRWQEVQGTAADLQATASAADPSSIR